MFKTIPINTIQTQRSYIFFWTHTNFLYLLQKVYVLLFITLLDIYFIIFSLFQQVFNINQSQPQSMSQNVAVQELLSIYNLCGEIDIELRKLNKRSIVLVGLSKSGKSTLYNYINGIQLYGVPPKGSEQFELFGVGNIDVSYAPRIVTSITAQANDGVKSVTLLPNIVDKGDHTLVDFPGYLDRRRYNAVVGVSYVLKGAFQLIQQCQFVLVLKFDYFRNSQDLFKAIRGFVNMFNFDNMTVEAKNRLLSSVTVVVTKAPAQAPASAYANIMRNFRTQLNDPMFQFQYPNSKQHISFLLDYFSTHERQFYLFKAAVLNENSPPCTIVQDHFNERSYFKLKQENENFLKTSPTPIIKLPFAEDFENMPNVGDKEELKKKLGDRVKSISEFTSHLQKFFKKAIDTRNLFDENLNFNELFKQIQDYNKKHNVYSKQFNWADETGLQTIFAESDPVRNLKTGIQLAQNVFKLYSFFSDCPEYNNQDDPSKLQLFMAQYKQHLINIITLFRNSFCTSFKQEQIILEFLFTASRACRQFSMLYQIRPDGKHDMCLQLKDCFQAILSATPLRNITKQFITELYNQIGQLEQRIKTDRDQIALYLKYLIGLQKQQGGSQIVITSQYKFLKKKFLQWMKEFITTPQQGLVANFDFLNEHKITVEQKLNQLNDEQGENYPQQLNFMFIHLLTVIGNILLDLQRTDNIEQDNFAYSRGDQIRRQIGPNGSIKQYLISQQVDKAIDIFTYVEDAESVLKAYDLILKNIPEKDYVKQFQYMKGMAKFCVKYGRIEQAIVLYQKLLKLCATGNLCDKYLQIKTLLSQIPAEREEKLKTYFTDLKHKHIIDPADDRELTSITDDLDEYFIKPYVRKMQLQRQNSD